jgi:hypothetical protein
MIVLLRPFKPSRAGTASATDRQEEQRVFTKVREAPFHHPYHKQLPAMPQWSIILKFVSF